ncbi:MAG TPA: hypothetical protein VEH57_03440 [Thermoplasmata archaeon]|nr:hypothetical protein [Thermoplasmata archaeon]
MFYLGDTFFGSGLPYGTQVRFYTCGNPGSAGWTPVLNIGLNPYDTANVSWVEPDLMGCTPTANNNSAIPLGMTFSNFTLTSGGGTTVVRQELQFLMLGSPPYTGELDAHGVTSWMVALNLTNSAGKALPVAASNCNSWFPSLSKCDANSSGWYAVLLSGDGSWQGSYGNTTSGPAWNYPVIPITTNQTLVVIVPSAWNVSGDSLDVSSTTTELPLTGSITFA